ncbi:MAG: sigma-54-dependent Fis family transcriptional regulator [Verrucomicrobia bacterium]|nr:sigma-54-dependent Fis family transcriptional regulator [Verrucomicrobiota bacterium]
MNMLNDPDGNMESAAPHSRPTLQRSARPTEIRNESAPQDHPLRDAMGPSDEVSRIIAEVERVAKSDFRVLILGESGSGKELVANALHQASHRANGPFVAIDCGAITETLLESDLFGHEKGAFTGATVRKIGKFETARGGTLFLDEISNMPLGSQAKLLRVLQERKICRVGGVHPIPIDVRVVVACNEDLPSLASSRVFRSDLFFRISEFTIALLPLRMRKDDILYLARRFLRGANLELNKNITGFSKAATELIRAYDWPGNVRKLRSTVRRAALLADNEIDVAQLDINATVQQEKTLFENRPQTSCSLSLKNILKRDIAIIEQRAIATALRETGWNKAKAARLLQIDYKTIHTKLKQYNIARNGEPHHEQEPETSRCPNQIA